MILIIEGPAAEITMYEALVRHYDTVATYEPVKTIQDAIDNLKAIDSKKEARRLKQKEKSRSEREAKLAAKAAAEAQASQGNEEALTSASVKHDRDEADVEGAEEPAAKRQQTETPAASTVADDANAMQTDTAPSAKPTPPDTPQPAVDEPTTEPVAAPSLKANGKRSKRDLGDPIDIMARPLPQVKGHTSYLTFATLLPRQPETIAANGDVPAVSVSAAPDPLASETAAKPVKGDAGSSLASEAQPPRGLVHELSHEELAELVDGVPFSGDISESL